MEKVYIVTCNWNVDGDDEHEIMGVFQNKQDALNKLKEERDKCINEHYKGQDYEIESDTDEHFEIQVNYYDKYEIVNVTQFDVK